jgi:hypothetical protein
VFEFTGASKLKMFWPVPTTDPTDTCRKPKMSINEFDLHVIAVDELQDVLWHTPRSPAPARSRATDEL